MSKKRKKEISFAEKLRIIKKAGLENTKPIEQSNNNNIDEILSIDQRIEKILGIFNNHKKHTNMLYFIMYDIENNKVRNHISKFLIRNGCVRVQKSIFLADSDRKTFDKIHKTLKEVNELYDNHDSIIFVPVSVDELRAMKLIGKNIDFDLIMNNKSTLFF
jgi:CRISPR-associated protein Cas2